MTPIAKTRKTDADVEATPGLGPDDDHEPISTMTTVCKSNFSRSLEFMASSQETKYADILRKLEAKFVDWATYLGVFAGGSASLDHRLLQRHQQYRDLVLLVLDTLNNSLLQTLVEPKDAETDSSLDDDMDRRQVELTGIQKSIIELDRLAIYIRQSSTSSLDARVKAFGARKLAEVATFEALATLKVNGLYPDASEILRQRLSKSMTHRYTKLLYWRSHDEKLRADRHRQGQPGDDRGTAATTVLQGGVKFPAPPKTEDWKDQKPCPYCRRKFSGTDFADVGWWKKHVNGDLVPFLCVSSTCSESPTFDSRSEWITHMEREHGDFRSWRSSILHCPRPEHSETEAQAAPGPGRLADLCPLCSCLPLDKPEDGRTGFQRPTAVAAETFNTRQGTVPLNEPSDSSKIAKKLARFEVTGWDWGSAGNSSSQLPAGVESMKTGGSAAQKAANTAMLNHIADHLQFLALLTPLLSTEKLADGEAQDFSSSLAISSDGAPEKRSRNLDDELETREDTPEPAANPSPKQPLEILASLPEASFDAANKQHVATCLPNKPRGEKVTWLAGPEPLLPSQGFSEDAPAFAKFEADLVAVWVGRTELFFFQNTQLYWSRLSREGDGAPNRGEIHEVHPDAQSQERPAVAALAGKLVAAWKGVNHDKLYFSTLDRDSPGWSDPIPIPGAGSSTGPALASLETNGLTRVYALWKGIPGDKNAWLAWYDGECWEGPIHLPFVETDANVSITCRGGEIFVSWKDSGTGRIKWMRLKHDGSELLEEPQELGRSAESNLGPALAELRGTLYAAWKGKGQPAEVWFTSWSGEANEFRPTQLAPNSYTDRAPSLVGWDDWLVLAWRGADHEKTMWWKYGRLG